MAKVRLGDIATVVTKGTTPTTMGFQFEDGGINFVKIESISEDGTLLKEKFSHISDECNVQMRRSQLQENDILFSIAGAIGRSAIVTKEILPANTNQALAIIRVPKGKIDYNYLLYALSSSAINQQATQHQQGVAQLNISLKNVSDFLLPIYTEAMQKRIVHNLKKIDKLISLRKQQLAKLDELVKARFVEMFGDPSNNPMGWKKQNFEDIALLITDGEHMTPQRTNKGIYLLSARNILNHTIQLDDVDYIDEEEYGRIARRIVPQQGDVLVSCSGSIGRCCVVPSELKFQMVRSVALIRFNNTINPIFAEWLIATDELQKQIYTSATQSSQANLFQGKIRKLCGYVPPLSLQNQFAAFVERVDKQKQTVQQSLEKLELMKKALMQEYFG